MSSWPDPAGAVDVRERRHPGLLEAAKRAAIKGELRSAEKQAGRCLHRVETKDLKSQRRFSPEKMQKVNLFETERMFADIYCLEPGQEQKRHAHRGADKIYLVLEGTGRFQIGDEERDLDQHQIVLAPADVEHGVRNDSQSRLTLLVFMAPNPNRA